MYHQSLTQLLPLSKRKRKDFLQCVSLTDSPLLFWISHCLIVHGRGSWMMLKVLQLPWFFGGFFSQCCSEAVTRGAWSTITVLYYTLHLQLTQRILCMSIWNETLLIVCASMRYFNNLVMSDIYSINNVKLYSLLDFSKTLIIVSSKILPISKQTS